MVIALLAVLRVDLGVLLAFLAFVLGRKRWVSHQPGAFRGDIRVGDGTIHGLGPKWHRGYGRWVRDVLVWTKAPFLLRNELVAVDGLDGQRPARARMRSSTSATIPSSSGSGSATPRSRWPPAARTAGWSSAPTALPTAPSEPDREHPITSAGHWLLLGNWRLRADGRG
jgi:hypothetical protein